MMEMCTARRRVLGTLVERGPWVMDGQLLLGTMPALNSTHAHESVESHTAGATGTFDKRSDLCISGGSLLILALCSITSFATFPLRTELDEKCKPCTLHTNPIHPPSSATAGLFFVACVFIPVSKATTLEEEVTAGHSSDLAGLLQPAREKATAEHHQL